MSHQKPRTPNAIDKWAGSRLRARRILLKMSQEALADKIGVSFQQVQKYEAGANRLSVSRLYFIARALEVPFDYFIDGFLTFKPEYEEEQSPVLEFIQSHDGAKLMTAFLAISNKDVRKQALQIVRTLGGT